MTNVEKIIFDAKFSVKYMNGKFVISGFTHVQSLLIKEEDIKEVLETIHGFNQEEWEDYIQDYKEVHKIQEEI